MTPFKHLMARFLAKRDDAKLEFMLSLAEEFKRINTDPKLIIDTNDLLNHFRSSKDMVVGRYEECLISIELKMDYVVFSTPLIKYRHYFYGVARPTVYSKPGNSYAAGIAQFSLGYEPVLANIISLCKNHMKRTLVYRSKDAKRFRIALQRANELETEINSKTTTITK